MALVDSNVWVALLLSKHEFHSVARAWFAQQTESGKVLFCRATQQSFLRLVTTAAVTKPYGSSPLSNKAAWFAYEKLLADPRIAWIEEPGGVELVWKRLSTNSKASPKLWMDAYLAAFTLTVGHQLVTTDKAFRQFKNLDVMVLENS